MRGATLYEFIDTEGNKISIHAPLAGRDRIPLESLPCTNGISIHAPLAGRDPKDAATKAYHDFTFQSTRPLRGATTAQAFSLARSRRISIHAPLAGRDK